MRKPSKLLFWLKDFVSIKKKKNSVFKYEWNNKIYLMYSVNSRLCYAVSSDPLPQSVAKA